MVGTAHDDRLHQVPSAATASLPAVLSDVLEVPGAAATVRFHGPSTPQYHAFVAGEPAVPQVLQPAVSASGLAEWGGRGVRCPIGALQQTYGSAIRHS